MRGLGGVGVCVMLACTPLTQAEQEEEVSTAGSPSSSGADVSTTSGQAETAGVREGSTALDDDSSTGDPDAAATTSGSSTSATTGDGEPSRCGDGEIEGDEQCDDRNDDDLDGCLEDCRSGPTGVEFGRASVLTQYGASGGVAYDDPCPAGEAVIGLRGEFTDVVTQIRAVCGAVELVDPDDIALSVTEASETALRGVQAGTPFDAVCDPGSVVVGARFRAGGGVDQVTLRCAPLTLNDDGRTLVIAQGTSADLLAFGGGGGMPTPQTDCPSGEVVTELNLRAGDRIDALGMTCRGPSLTY